MKHALVQDGLQKEKYDSMWQKVQGPFFAPVLYPHKIVFCQSNWKSKWNNLSYTLMVLEQSFLTYSNSCLINHIFMVILIGWLYLGKH